MFRRLRLCLVIALCGFACASTQIQERCRFVTHHVPQPPMPPEFAAIDRHLVGRAIAMTQQCRELAKFREELGMPKGRGRSRDWT
jgi:hypothetical protein